MRNRKLLAGCLAAMMMMNVCGASLTSYAAGIPAVQDNPVVQEQSAEVSSLSEMIETVNTIISSDEDDGFQKIMDVLLTSKGDFYEILTGLSQEVRVQLLEKLTAEETYQLALYSKYAFVEEMIEYKEKDTLEKSDMEELNSYVDIYVSIVESYFTKEVEPEKIAELEQEVLTRIVAQSEDGKEVKDFAAYAEYLQSLTDLDVMKAFEKLETFSNMEDLQNAKES